MDPNIEPNMEQEHVGNDYGLDAKYLAESSSALSNSSHEHDEMDILSGDAVSSSDAVSSGDVVSETNIAVTMNENKGADHQDSWDLLFENGDKTDKSVEDEKSGVGNVGNNDTLIDLCSSQEVTEQNNDEEVSMRNSCASDREECGLQDSVIIHSDVECHLFDNVGSYEAAMITQDNIVIEKKKEQDMEMYAEACPEIDSFDEREEENEIGNEMHLTTDNNCETENEVCHAEKSQEPCLEIVSDPPNKSHETENEMCPTEKSPDVGAGIVADKSLTNSVEKSLESSQHSEFEDTFASNREMLIKDRMSEGSNLMQDTVMVSSSISEVEIMNTVEGNNKEGDLTKSILEQNEAKQIDEVQTDDIENKEDEERTESIEVEIVEHPQTIKKKLVETIEHCIGTVDNDRVKESEVHDSSMKEVDVDVLEPKITEEDISVTDKCDSGSKLVDQSENVENPSPLEHYNETDGTPTSIPSEEAVLIEMTTDDNIKETIEQEHDTKFEPESLDRENESDEITEMKVKFDSSKQIDIKGAYFRECSQENDPTPSPVSEVGPLRHDARNTVKPIEPGQVRELEALYTEFESQVSDFLCFAESNLRSAQDGEEGHTEILRGEYFLYFTLALLRQHEQGNPPSRL